MLCQCPRSELSLHLHACPCMYSRGMLTSGADDILFSGSYLHLPLRSTPPRDHFGGDSPDAGKTSTPQRFDIVIGSCCFKPHYAFRCRSGGTRYSEAQHHLPGVNNAAMSAPNASTGAPYPASQPNMHPQVYPPQMNAPPGYAQPTSQYPGHYAAPPIPANARYRQKQQMLNWTLIQSFSVADAPPFLVLSPPQQGPVPTLCSTLCSRCSLFSSAFPSPVGTPPHILMNNHARKCCCCFLADHPWYQ